MLTAPSGYTFSRQDVNLLYMMKRDGFVRYSKEPFRLKSGIESHVYVYGREDFTDHPDLGKAVGDKILDDLLHKGLAPSDGRSLCLIGIPTAGTSLAAAASLCTNWWDPGYQVGYRIMRESKKSHGAHQSWVNGKPDLEHQTYVLVDNVATNGQSKIEADAKIVEDGYPPHLPVYIFIDRQQGAIDHLRAAGFSDIVIGFNLLDVTYAYGELGLWPRDTVQKVEQELAGHRNLLN